MRHLTLIFLVVLALGALPSCKRIEDKLRRLAEQSGVTPKPPPPAEPVLTPEEQALLATATPEDWINGAAEAVRSPEFWADLGAAFVDGFLRGLSR